MRMNLKRVAALTFALAIMASASACNQVKKQTGDDAGALKASALDDSSPSSLLEKGIEGGYSEGIFADYSESFAEMEKERTIQIVRGVVKSVEPASPEALAQKAVVEVNCVYKGRELNSINVFQLYDDPVEAGGEYLLFLTEQYPDDPASADFTTVGGNQGALKIDRQSRSIVVNSHHIADNDLKQWLIKNISDKKDDSAQIADYEIVLRSELNND